jgi:DNA invertase Pin-like site-specific DNA recombinase
MNNSLVPAAQYLRMSTDHQQYSLDNQADAIAVYAALHGFVIVKTYSDAARSGLSLKRREGLKQLLADVVASGAPFRAILVYDISRWGRFQDLDEAAHYEYLCKSSGVPVHYCAESFVNDKGMPDLIMKALKRTMAGEYSRELSVKVTSGLRRIVGLGYKPGGKSVYGLRRQLLDAEGKPKQILNFGEWKNLVTEHVRYVPGPANECDVINRIFREFADEGQSLRSIASRLNGDGVPYLMGRGWTVNSVIRTLRQTKYMGVQIWGRSTEALSTPRRPVSREHWVISDTGFKPIVSRELFERAEKVYAELTHRLTNEEMLDKLRVILRENGRLNRTLIDQTATCPGLTTYCKRFGGLRNVYALLGLRSSQETAALLSKRQQMLFVRDTLAQRILEKFRDQLSSVRRNRRIRVRLRVRSTGLIMSLAIGRWHPTTSGKIRWTFYIPKRERKSLAIVALLDSDNENVKELWVMPHMTHSAHLLQVREGGNWFSQGERVGNLDQLLEVVNRVRTKSRSSAS